MKTQHTIFAVVRGGSFVVAQDNLPVFEETLSTPRPPATEFSWTVSNIGGDFTDEITTTEIENAFINFNANKTSADLDVDVFESLWEGGFYNGSFTLTLDDLQVPANPISYSININLRAIPSIDYTVVGAHDTTEAKTMCGNGAPNTIIGSPAAAAQYLWNADSVSSDFNEPGDVIIDFSFDDAANTISRIDVAADESDWTAAGGVDGTFALSITDGTNQSDFNGNRGGVASTPRLSLRRLVADGYTVVNGQTYNVTNTGTGINGAGALGALDFDATNFSDGDVSDLSLDGMGRVQSCTNSGDWSQECIFDLSIQDGYRPATTFNAADGKARALTLRDMVGDKFILFAGQTAGGPGINAAGGTTQGFTFEPDNFSDGDFTSLMLDDMGRMTVWTFTGAYDHDVTFDLRIKDGPLTEHRPTSWFPSYTITLKQLTPVSLTILDDNTADDQLFGVASDTDSWIWASCTFVWETGETSQTFGDTCNPSSTTTSGMTVDWGATALTGPCTGHFDIVLQRADVVATPLAPTCTVEVDVTINEQVGISGDDEFTLFTSKRAGGLVRQNNRPLVTVHDVPSSGDWDWAVESVSGGGGGITAAMFDFDMQTSTTANLMWRVDASDATTTTTLIPEAEWKATHDLTINLRLAAGRIYPITVSLRWVDLIDFFHFGALQTGQGGASISGAPGGSGDYSWSDNGNSDITIAESGTNNVDAAFTATSGSAGSVVTFMLSITDSTRPASNFDDASMTRCTLDNTSLTILDDNTADSQLFQIVGDSGSWIWHSCAFVWETGETSQTFGDTCDPLSTTTSGMTVDWGAPDLTGPCTGHFAIVLQRANVVASPLAPTCTVDVDVTINEQKGISGNDAFTLFASKRDSGLTRQSNRPLITVNDVPSSGDWDWAVESVSGGAGITTDMFDFDMQTSTTANLMWRVDPSDSSTTTTVIPEDEWKATHNLTVNLRLAAGRIYPITVSLRWVDCIDTFHFGSLQTGQGIATITGAPGGGGDYAWSDNGNADVTIAESGTNNVNAAFTATSGATGSVINYMLSITDSTRPASNFDDAKLTRCSLDHTSLTIVDDDTGDNQPFQIVGDAGSWIWHSCTFVWESGSTSQTFGDTCDPLSTTTGSMTVDWGATALEAPCTGHFDIVLQRADVVAAPLSPTCTVEIDVTIQELVNDFDILTESNDHTLPIGRERMRYWAKLHMDIPATEAVVWSVAATTPDAPAGVFELVTETGIAANEKILQTVIDTSGGTSQAIPEGWDASSPATVTVTAIMGSQQATVDLSLEIHATAEDIDVAILLDRSGSMWSGNRWQAASDGAQAFAELVATVGSGYDHNVGIYWFQGNCWDRNHDHTTYDPNPHVGTVTDSTNDFSIGTGDALANWADIEPLLTSWDYRPGGCTAIGTGLVHSKDELNSLTNDHEKVILTLSDGMENCAPLLNTVFPDGSTSTYWTDGAGMRLYFVAVLTNPSWVTTLRNVVHRTHGIRSEDVKHIEQGTSLGDTTMSIEQWFYGSFKQLFGYTSLNEIPDPTLDGGDWDTHPVTANLGVDRLIFYMLLDKKDDGKWEFGAIPPGQDAVIYARHADDYDGVRCFEGSTHKTLVIDLPLSINGHAHRWAGDWKMVVGRHDGAEARSYIVGAMAHQDLDASAEVIAPRGPRPGDKAMIRVELKDQNGRAIKTAAVKTVLHKPGKWPGHAISMEVHTNPKLVKKLRRSKSKSAIDTDQVADQVLRELYDRSALKGGSTETLSLKHVKNGVYQKEITLKNPGNYNLEISIEGERKTPRKEINTKLGDARRDIRRLYRKRALVKAETTFLNRFAGTKQAFKIECREQVAVGFLPSEKNTEVQGYFVTEDVLRFRVQPRDKNDVLLGPGWEDSICFDVPGIARTWPAWDAGDSSYWVDIPIDATNPRLHRRRNVLVADRFKLLHPVDGDLSPENQELPLEGFGVTILGVRIPITVYALIGNKRSKEVHLAICEYASRISERNRVFIHDINEAKRYGYDTCEWCLPLVCNTNPTSMEAHKPFCSHVKNVARKNRLEVHSWRQAKKLGFDGCFYCLRKHHTR